MTEKLRDWYSKQKPMLRSGRFWGAQCFVLAIAIVHLIIETINPEMRIQYLIPVGLLWIPVVYMALTFGTSGAMATALWALITAIPEWAILKNPSDTAEYAEMALLLVLAFVIGRQADFKMAAEKRAAAAATYAINSQERERQKLSYDLHDETIQQLVAVCQQLDLVRNFGEPLPPSSREGLEMAKNDLEEVIMSMRNIVRGLRPPVLDDLGFLIAIRQMCSEFKERSGIDCRLEVSGKERKLPKDVELHMFRIAQEALHNIERHAQASRVMFTMAFADNGIKMDIADNGIGFDGSTSTENQDGLVGIMKRAEMLGGRAKIDSVRGRGTRISVSIPLKGAPPGAVNMALPP